MLHLSGDDFHKMAEWAREHMPEEACGLLAGYRDEEGDAFVERVFICENADHTSEHFTISPKEQLRALKEARSSGMEILGNWHSHPETPARPSAEDLRLAQDPSALYCILSLEDPAWPALVAYCKDADGNVARVLVSHDA
jgi:proteasome lid subunit RPN8/RPN11